MDMVTLILSCLALIIFAYHEVGVLNRIETLEKSVNQTSERNRDIRVWGPDGVLYMRQDQGYTLVEDEYGNELFKTDKNPNVAIQWAIDHQSSGVTQA